MSMVQGTSLMEARRLYQLLQDTMVLLERVEKKSKDTAVSLTKLLTVTNSLLLILNRSGLGTEYEEIITKLRFLIMFLQRIQTMALAANIAMTAGPVGMLLGLISLGITAISTIDMAGSVI